MDQVQTFSAEKEAVINTLQRLRGVVSKLDDIGIGSTEQLEKIESSIASLAEDQLRIALVGAFSDGKTSVIAGWLGEILPSMKIDIDESSDEIAVYQPQNLLGKCKIIDTPGLFGDKRTTGEGIGNVLYSDITKKYVSEANLIFYIVDATNPLKDSHKETVKWLLRDLNKLPNTVFVINKMDEVADLRDQASFDNQARIKKENVIEKLVRFVNLTDDEKRKINIVCVSADPNNRGLSYWLKKREDYEMRSRIPVLKETTQQILATTTRTDLIQKTGLDVVSDILVGKMNAAKEQLDATCLFAESKQQEISRIGEDIAAARKEIISAKGDLFRQLNDLEKSLLNQLRPLSLPDIKAFIEDELGLSNKNVGYKLNLKINNMFEQCFNLNANIMDGIKVSITKQIDATDTFIESVSLSAISSAGGALQAVNKMPLSSIKNGIFQARNALADLTGKVIKFAPHEAKNLAGSIGKYAGPAGAVLQLGTDAYTGIKAHQEEKRLAEIKNELGEVIKGIFKYTYDVLSDNSKVLSTFAPDISKYEDVLTKLKTELLEMSTRKARVLELQNDMKAIGKQTQALSQ